MKTRYLFSTLCLILFFFGTGFAETWRESKVNPDGTNWTEFKTAPSDGAAQDEFGHAVSMNGDIAIVGVKEDDDLGAQSGSAYIFRRSGTTWNQEKKLTADDGMANDEFGNSVSISGDIVVVGAPFADSPKNAAGAAYIFRYNGTTWNQEAKLTANDAAPADQFGYAVAISGNVILVGSRHDDDKGFASGSAYVFRYNGTTWNPEAKFTASDGSVQDNFGSAVALSGNLALVGAEFHDDVNANSGSAYVFYYDGSTWSEETRIDPSISVSNVHFGYSVSISGDVALIGTETGEAAFIFRRGLTGWQEEAHLTSSDAASNDRFGASVTISNDLAIVTSKFDDDAGSNSGSAYVFRYNGTTWNEDTKLTASDATATDQFGASVSLSGGHAIVGATHDDVSGTNSGAVYFYTLQSNDPPVADAGPDQTIECDALSPFYLDGSGSSDPDGDALTYTWTGSFGIETGVSPAISSSLLGVGTHTITLIVHDGQDTHSDDVVITIQDTASPQITLNGANPLILNQGTPYFEPGAGVSDACDGDLSSALNISGSVDENAVGLYFITYTASDQAGNEASAVRIVNVLPDDTPPEGVFGDETTLSVNSAISFGNAISVSGDVAIIGDKGDAELGAFAGAAYIYRKSSTGWLEEVKLTASDGAALNDFGTSVAISGNVAIVSAPRHENKGAAYVFTYDGTNWVEQAKLIPEDYSTSGNFGVSVAINGDLAVVCGRSGSTGAAYVFRKTSSGWTQEAKWISDNASTTDFFGTALAISGDLVCIGASGNDDLFNNSGAVYVFRRSLLGWSQEAKLYSPNATYNTQFGVSLSAFRDIILIGARENSGKAYIFRFDGTDWNYETQLLPSSPETIFAFANSVAIGPDIAISGSQNNGPSGTQASVHVFRKSSTGWSEQSRLQSIEPDVFQFGQEVAFENDQIFASARNSVGRSVRIFTAKKPPLALTISNAPASTVEGNTVQFTVEANRPSDDPSVTIILSDGPSGSTFNGTTFNWTPDLTQAGVYTITFTATESGSSPVEETVTLLVNDAVVAGANVVSSPVDPETGTFPATLTFESVTQPGASTATKSDSGPEQPPTFKLGDPPVYCDLSTTATYDGNVTVELHYDGSTFEDESQLRLFHFENGAWVDITVALDTVNDIITGVTTSLSPFAVFQATNQPPELAAIDDQTVDEGQVLTLTVTATDPNGTTPALSASNLPSFGAFVDNEDGTGTLTLSPGFTDAGDYTGIEVTATDGTLSDSVTFDLTVNDVNRDPVASAGDDQTVECPAPGAIEVTVSSEGSSDPDGDAPLSYTWLLDETVLAGPIEATSVAISVSGLGAHTITLKVEDGKGGSATDDVVVEVVDTTVPEFTLTGDNPLIWECNTPFEDPGATISDLCDPEPTLVVEGAVDVSTLGTYTLTYTGTDASENETVETRTVEVVDTTPPTVVTKNITVELDENGEAAIGAEDVDDGSSDNCSIVSLSVSPSAFDCTNLGEVTVTLTATDQSDNSASATAVVTVLDVTPPKIVSISEDVLLECTNPTGEEVSLSVDASDLCDQDLDFKWFDELDNLLGDTPVITHIFVLGQHTARVVVTDDSGNSSEEVVSVIIQDTTPPEATASLEPTTKPGKDDDDDDDGPDGNWYAVVAEASDLCDEDPSVTAWITQPLTDSDDFSVSYKKHKKKNEIEIKVKDDKIEVVLKGADEGVLQGLLDQAIAQGGFDVADGQVINVNSKPAKKEKKKKGDDDDDGDKSKDARKGAYQYDFDADLTLQGAKGVALELVVVAEDASGNQSDPVFASPPRRNAKPVLSKPALKKPADTDLVFGAGNYPNPFNPDTVIHYTLPEPADVRLIIYNKLGQEVRTLIQAVQTSGRHTIRWNGRDALGQEVTSGVYIYRLQAGTDEIVKKMILIK